MGALGYLITGGFAKGYRTYLLAAVAAITCAVQFAVGDINFTDALNGVAMAIGLGTVRGAVADNNTAIKNQ